MNSTSPSAIRPTPTPTYLTMSSADVAHSFWVPRLAGKTDVIPNRVNTMWIDPAAARPVPRPMRAILRHAARKDAVARLCANSRGLCGMGQPAEAACDCRILPAIPLRQKARPSSCTTPASTAMRSRGPWPPGDSGPTSPIWPAATRSPPEPFKTRRKTSESGSTIPTRMKPGSLMPAMHLNNHDLDAVTAYLTQLR